MRRAAVGCVLVALVAAPAVCGAARRALTGSAVTVYVDGVKVGPTDEVTGAPLNGFMVGEVPMIPVRLFDSVLHDGLDLYLWRWQVFQLSNPKTGLVAFKLGDKVALLPMPAVGGSLARPLYLPVAPQLIDDHLYIPAQAVLKELGHAATWDSKTRTLRTTKKADGAVTVSP